MKYKKIPKTSITVSQVALGTWPMSGEYWGSIAESTCIDTIHAALDTGINFIDTAPFYGDGRAELYVGKAVKTRRPNVVIATKCGLQKSGRAVKTNLKPESIRKELEESLKRLQTDYIDLYQTHWPDPNTPIEDTLKEMQAFVKEGKVKALGICNADKPLLEKAMSLGISTIQNEFSLLQQESERDIFPICESEKIGFLAYGPLAGGILTGKYKEEPKLSKNDPRRFFYKYYQGEAFASSDKTVGALRTIAQIHKTTPTAVALAWIIQKAAVLSVLVGAKSPEQVRINAQAGKIDLPRSELDCLSPTQRYSHG